jgi:DNA-binding transcriptional ArsR family regulator
LTATSPAGVGVSRLGDSSTARSNVRGAAASRKAAGRWRMSSTDRGVEGYPSTLVREGADSRTVADVERERPAIHFAAVDAVRHDTQRRILHTLASENGRVTYSDLGNMTTTSDRTVRKHATKLVENGLIDRTNANLVFFEFASHAAEILVRENLTRWYDRSDA